MSRVSFEGDINQPAKLRTLAKVLNYSKVYLLGQEQQIADDMYMVSHDMADFVMKKQLFCLGNEATDCLVGISERHDNMPCTLAIQYACGIK